MAKRRRRRRKNELKLRTVWALFVLGAAGWLTEPMEAWSWLDPRFRLAVIVFLELVVGIALPWWLLWKSLMWADWKWGSGRRMREKAGLQKRRRFGGLILRTRFRFGKPNRHLRANFSQNGMTSVSAQLAKGVVWNSGTGRVRFDLWGPFSWETKGRYRPQLQSHGNGNGNGQKAIAAAPRPQWQPHPGKPGEEIIWIDGVAAVRRYTTGPRGGKKRQWGVAGKWYERETDAFIAVANLLGAQQGEPVAAEVVDEVKVDPDSRYPWEDGWSEYQQAQAAAATGAFDKRRK